MLLLQIGSDLDNIDYQKMIDTSLIALGHYLLCFIITCISAYCFAWCFRKGRIKIGGIHCKLLTHEKDYIEFKYHYDEASGATLPIEYFIDRKVYAFYNNFKMIAGFIVGTRKPFRTIDVFVNDLDRNKVNSIINDGENCCEVCAFWMAKKSYTLWRSVYIWFTMARCVQISGKDLCLAGTKAFGLAKMYGYSRYSPMIYTGEVNGKQTWVFKPLRKYVYLSAIEIIIYKLKKAVSKSLFKKSLEVVFRVSTGIRQ